MTPYKDVFEDGQVVIRRFDESIDPEELKWHRDREDRTIEPLGDTDWKFQADGQLPILIKDRIFIPKGSWHRIVKGSGSVDLKITKS
jgi:hypothetical protein